MRIESISARPWNVELTEPFGIATGVQNVARNAIVEVRLSDGSVGLGEAAPFAAVNGETQDEALAVLDEAQAALVGLPIASFHAPDSAVRNQLGRAPSALAAVEVAVLDAECRARGESMFAHFGGRVARLCTDITIPTGTPDAAAEAAERARRDGFRTLKVKVGGAALEHDLGRLLAVTAAWPSARLLLDANASLSASAALALLDGLGAARRRVVVFEQPCRRGDFAGARILRRAGVRIAADEDARSAADVERLHAEQAADVINLKLTKCGLAETLGMIEAARACGFGLMIGGMVETRLTMTVSACIAGGIGGFEEVDLDTPLFMGDDGLDGGSEQHGPDIDLGGIAAGHGVEWRRR